MTIAIDTHNYSIDNVYFGEPIKNAVIDNGKFIRIFYSNDVMTLNGIYIKIDADVKKMDENEIENLLCEIRKIESGILDKINIPGKTKVIKICDYLMVNINPNTNTNPYVNINAFANMNLFSSTSTIVNSNSAYANGNGNIYKQYLNFSKFYNLNKMLLKISGVWETTHEYGLTFKFIEINRQ